MSNDPPSRRAILVLGMHRSGTSALTRVVTLLGAAGPAHPMRPGPDNPRGFWESERITGLNDAMLAAGGSSWKDWTRFDAGRLPPDAMAGFIPKMRAALQEEFGSVPLLVLKDPRLSRLLPLWLPALEAEGIAPSALIALRHPAAVAQSLAARNGLAPETSLLLWLRHVLDAERLTRGVTRDFVSYDALLADWRGMALRFGSRLGVDWPVAPDAVADEIGGFLDPALRHSNASDLATRSAYAEVWSRHAWEALRELERSGPGGPPLATLDRVRAQFEDACGLFAPAVARPPRPDLRDVTLCAADSHAVPLSVRAMRACAEECDFGDAVLFTDAPRQEPFRVVPTPPLRSRADYSRFVLRDLLPHIGTSHALVVQWDGWVTNPAAWQPDFLEYDYVGAPWAARGDGMDVGNGGFSLRSRRLLEALQGERFAPVPDIPEDELIGRVWRPALERDHAIRFAPVDVAARFAYERIRPRTATFGFHGIFNVAWHLDDAGLAEFLALLPESALHRREYAELAALCLAAGRDRAVRLLAGVWERAATPDAIRSALWTVLRDDAAVADFMGRAGLR